MFVLIFEIVQQILITGTKVLEIRLICRIFYFLTVRDRECAVAVLIQSEHTVCIITADIRQRVVLKCVFTDEESSIDIHSCFLVVNFQDIHMGDDNRGGFFSGVIVHKVVCDSLFSIGSVKGINRHLRRCRCFCRCFRRSCCRSCCRCFSGFFFLSASGCAKYHEGSYCQCNKLFFHIIPSFSYYLFLHTVNCDPVSYAIFGTLVNCRPVCNAMAGILSRTPRRSCRDMRGA